VCSITLYKYHYISRSRGNKKKKKKKDAMAMDNQTSSMHIYACVINKANCSYTEREIEWSEIDDKDNI